MDYPTPRNAHAMAYDSARGVVVLYGGWDGTRYADTWEWNGSHWADVSPGGTEGVDYPSAGSWPKMAYNSKRGVVTLFGGYSGGYQDETWEWDGANWTQMFPASKPPARSQHAMAYDSKRQAVLLFGGNRGSYCDDGWEWNGCNWAESYPANKPSARCAHAMVYDSKRGVIVLFGGFDGSSFDDTWEY